MLDVCDAKSIMVDVSENCKAKSVPAPVWQCIKDSVNTLVDEKVGSDVKQEVGLLLLRNISLLERRSSHARADKSLEERCATVVEYLNELREHVHVTVGKVVTIVEKAALVDEQSEMFWKRIASMEERIRIMDNVNCNFRKIMKLENDFLRDLLRADRETIRRLRAKLIALQTRMRQLSNTHDVLNCSDASDSDSESDSTETVVAPGEENRLPVAVADPSAVVQHEMMDEGSPSDLMDNLADLILHNINKEDILRLFKDIRSKRTNTS